MVRRRSTRLLLRFVAALAALFGAAVLAIVAGLVIRGGAEGGLVAAARLLRHGPATVDDFRLYPARYLRPSEQPAPFPSAASGAAPPSDLPAPDGGLATVEAILRQSRTRAFLVIKADRVVFEHYAAGRGPAEPSQYFSVTKSILSTLVGMAVDDGLIGSIEQPVTDFVPELAARGFARVTLRQLLDMVVPLDYEENENPFGLHVLMNYTSRLEALILGFRLRDGNAAGFRYQSGASALLSLALRRAIAPLTLTEYAQRRLWTPLGMEDGAVWTLDRADGMEKAWCCLAGTARDLAKLGRLYLSRGRIGERMLLAEGWIEASAPGAPPGAARPYALGWWPAGRDGASFTAAGKDGQFLFVAPAHQAIIVRLGEKHGYSTTGGWTQLFAALAAHDWRQP
jgi:CubicO group peptidase (beta-lactamase class C family)